MGKIIVTIEKGKDLYGAWADNLPGIYADGQTVKETKENILYAIELYKKHNKIIPEELAGNIEIEWKFDIQSLLQFYSTIFTNAALERMTGINQKQLWKYANGLSKPRDIQKRKIEDALHTLGNELLSVSL
ncbi:type II toxin-antitoxin system HicB family antitoxin [Bacteroides sp. 519]|uniref:type II toxin-antitoxin system HicB family antitoxin n=1 Tax=Bacteroides sp. 519 TaxID=2302937 RepID=UPI0013D19EAF|nr:type II toxin-antitoxin system HicB family antitoxin [Bacteroides sp. 519]NDV57286.1 type II toxin-antitoxin system HicB family antitoxin [Bacteroides sp. 519]